MTLDVMRAERPKMDALDEKAREAVRVFRSLQPTLDAYFHAITGRTDGRVLPAVSDNGSTDGKNIYYRPPVELGNKTPHERAVCDKRDMNTGKQLCPACRIREKVLTTIYHEIAHNAFGSFEATSDAAKKRAIEWAIREARGKHAEAIKARVDGAPNYKKADYLNLASLVNEFLPTIVGILEDARVDTALFREKPGTKRMFEADNREIFEQGFEGRDPDTGALRTFQWREAPQNNQVMIGLYCKITDLDYQTWFLPKVVEALNDTELTRLTDGMENVRSAGAVYNLSFKVLQRLRELGFCGTPQDPDPEPEPEPEEQPEPEPEPEPEEEPSDESEEESGDEVDEDASTESKADDSPDEGERSEGGSDEAGEDEPESEPSGGGDGLDQSSPGTPDEDQEDANGNESGAAEADSGQDGEVDEDEDGTPPEGDSSSSSESEGEAGSESSSDERPSSGGSDESDQSSGDDPGRRESSSDESGQVDEEADGTLDGTERSEGDTGERHSEGESDPGEEDAEPIDTGADDGYGGTQVDFEVPEDEPEMGTPDDAAKLIKLFGDHDEKPRSIDQEDADEAIDKAIIQGIYFTTPSINVYGVIEHYYGKPILDANGNNVSRGWRNLSDHDAVRRGTIGDFSPPETVISPSVIKIRRAFSDNQRGASQTNLRRGRVDNRVLGRRAWNGDPHLFRRDSLPGRKDWHVILLMDLSGSTVGENIKLEKRMVMGQCEMLARAGISFEVYAHTGNYHYTEDGRISMRSGFDMHMYHIKDGREPWDDKTRLRLQNISSCDANLDGHALEFGRKKADVSRATNKVILYYSDGKMPAANHDEELEILQREIGICAGKGYILLGVGIRTDSPRAHGLDTVEVHGDDDLVKVVEHLGRRISGDARR